MHGPVEPTGRPSWYAQAVPPQHAEHHGTHDRAQREFREAAQAECECLRRTAGECGECHGEREAGRGPAHRGPTRSECPTHAGHGYSGSRLSPEIAGSPTRRFTTMRSLSSAMARLPVRTNRNGSTPCTRQAMPANIMRAPKYTALKRCSV